MADLIEQDEYTAGVFQIEEDTVWLGGEAGPANNQGQALANRTKWLKAQLEALAAETQPLDGDLTAIAALVSAANKLLYATGPGAWALADLTAFARTLLAAADAATARATIGAASPADVAAAIAALVNSSPAALDTLNELAAALGNDANYAATITAALALKAPLLSPALTGSPTAPTQAQFDRSTKLATTLWVKDRGLESASVLSVTTNATLGNGYFGATVLCAGASGAIAVTLPTIAGDGQGKLGLRCALMNVGAYAVTVQRQGTDVIYVSNTSVTSLVLNPGDSLIVEIGDVGKWYAAGGTAPLGYAGVFGSLLAGNGYQKLPSGLIFQWGSFTSSASSGAAVAVTFPISFPTAVDSIVLTPYTTGTSGYSGWFDAPTTNGFGGRSSVTSQAIKYMAIGR